MDLVLSAAMGDVMKVREALAAAVDVESVNHARCTAIQAAASNNHLEIVEVLLSAGARIDARDENMMTALLTCTRKGYISTARSLVAKGADPLLSDRYGRGALYYSVLSENLLLVRFFLKPENCNQVEKFWGWTPLILAANKGLIEIVRILLEAGASIYRRSNTGETAEDVAELAGRVEVQKFLREVRLSAALQHVHTVEETKSQIWIGDHGALTVDLIVELGISHIVCIVQSAEREDNPSALSWLGNEEATRRMYQGEIGQIEVVCKIVSVDDEDRSHDSWTEFSRNLQMLSDSVHYASQVCVITS